MAEDTVHKQQFAIRGLATRSATLYPTRAEIIRDINEITLNVSQSNSLSADQSANRVLAWLK